MRIKKILFLPIFGSLLALMSACGHGKATGAGRDFDAPQPAELTMLVGSYTNGDTTGIYSFRFNQEDGTAKALGNAVANNPSYLAPSSDGRFVYAVSELEADDEAAVLSFSFDKATGTFRFINSQKTSGGAPCYVLVDSCHVVTANYLGGSISIFSISEDGALMPSPDVLQFSGSGVDRERQDQPHLHCVRLAPDGDYLFADDLGTDRIYKFKINKGNRDGDYLQPGTPPFFEVKAGSGPRHLTFSSSGDYAYLINEMSGTVVAFEYADGNLNEIQTAYADTVGARGSGDIHISPDGTFLYASNRLKADGIAIFAVDSSDGRLARVGYQLTGVHPRNFIITPNGRYLLVACRDSNVIQVFLRDAVTGLLADTHHDICLPKPVCIRFLEEKSK